MNSKNQINTDLPGSREELERFRQDWLKEVASKKRSEKTAQSTLNEVPSITHEKTQEELVEQNLNKYPSTQTTGLKWNSLSLKERRTLGLAFYKEAVYDERQGKLGEALAKYRRAFKLDPDVDLSYKTYFKQLNGSAELDSTLAPPFDGTEEEFEFISQVYLSKDYVPAFEQMSNESEVDWAKVDPMYETLQEMLEENRKFLIDDGTIESQLDKELNISRSLRKIAFKAATPTKPCHIVKLPDVLLLRILHYLLRDDPASIGKFANTCIKALFLTRDNHLWRGYGNILYHPKSVLSRDFRAQHPGVSLEKYIQTRYRGQWRPFLIDYPRVRFDGIYIATCTYIRQGVAESSYSQPIHLITYYRYLRFYPNGTCLILLTPSEPAQTVHNIHTKQNSAKDLLTGYYNIADLNQINILATGAHRPGTTFHINLDLRSTSRGRHNKLSWVNYYSNYNDEVQPYSLKQFKAFYFSRVKSYRLDWNHFIISQ